VEGLVDEVAERALQLQGFCGEGTGGLDGAGVFVSQRVEAGGGLVLIELTLAWNGAGICMGRHTVSQPPTIQPDRHLEATAM
jgi:hypothetical protein